MSGRKCRHKDKNPWRRGCPVCQRRQQKLWRRKRAKDAAYMAARRKRDFDRRQADPVPLMLARAKKRARAAGLPFALTRADIVVPLCCPVLNIPLRPGVKRSGDSSPSLDRIDPAKGYVPGNVAVISQRANQIKNVADYMELYAVAIWLERQRG